MGKKKRIRNPPANRSRHIKEPSTDQPDPDAEPPKFSLRYLTGEYCISQCERDEKAAFADTLYRLSQLTWRELRQAPREKLGYEQIDRNSIRAQIPYAIPEERAMIAIRCIG